MRKIKRHHSLLIVRDLGKALRNSAFIILYLFVIKSGSETALIRYGRVIFLAAFGFAIAVILFRWFTHKYEADERGFRLYSGLFKRQERTIPYGKIQNTNQIQCIFHKLFRVTSIQFETAMAGQDSRVDFPVVSYAEAALLKERARGFRPREADITKITAIGENRRIASEGSIDPTGHTQNKAERKLHFKAGRQDILRASVSSLSFMLLSPLLVSLYFKAEEILPVGDQLNRWWRYITESWWLGGGIVLILIIASILFGMVNTFKKYGNYEILSDRDFIYISRGMVEHSSFSIAKKRVQAVEIVQSPLKRLLGLAEVKFTSAGSVDSDANEGEVNSLYPFLRLPRAYEMVSELLPDFTVSYEEAETMKRLPFRSIILRLARPSWLWAIATILLCYFQPSILGQEGGWWMLSVLLLVVVTGLRILDFLRSRYKVKGEYLQIKKGSLSTHLVITKREKIIEAKISRSLLQRKLRLATIEATNRTKPVKVNQIKDVPLPLAVSFQKWYKEWQYNS